MSKTKVKWVNFLHFYLPPHSDEYTVREAAEKSYLWLIKMAKQNRRFVFTFNITACLTELLIEYGYEAIIKDLSKLIKRGQLELVDSLAFHPLTPLLPPSEITRQIKLNQKINRSHFGIKAKGFFLPEMAYSPAVGKIIASLKYNWLILDEIALSGKRGFVDWQTKYILKKTNLKIVFRSWYWSKDYVPRRITHHHKENNLPQIIVSATDAELYGLRFADEKNWLNQALNIPYLLPLTISNYLRGLKKIQPISPISSNWESLEQEIKQGIPYALWRHPRNKIQQQLWQLAKIAWQNINKHTNYHNYFWARRHLDWGLASCTFWWASDRDFRLLGPPAWKPDEVERGATELIKSIRTLPLSPSTKIKAEKIFHQIKQELWIKHWRKYG